ncbi:iron-sulfur cluster biosynthesis family protein [Paenibacillus thailandensis]|uniref:Iron-sulfur cluster biosynthesis family protein n=1 Tax=Paenibacillus thailandensis TaxID=393250 RepID=A0ABW5QTJ6_9BACL
MHIQFSEAAADKLRPYLADGKLRLKFVHDTEGCGCVVSGVPALHLVRESGPDDRIASGEPFDFLYEPRHEIYYEPNMRIGFDPAGGSFTLTSDGQIYSTNVKLVQPAAASSG